MGKIDRIVRSVLAIIAGIFAFTIPMYWLLIITAIFGITATVGFCPLYKIFNFSTQYEKAASSQ